MECPYVVSIGCHALTQPDALFPFSFGKLKVFSFRNFFREPMIFLDGGHEVN
jgi:hypothetical protein